MARTDTKILTYDEEAEASGWYGPEVAFGLAFKHVYQVDSHNFHLAR